ncbi:hypothetical protein HYT52_01310 [Candidatus Woesearchaeota archaeon]|nr:hypothetical protein [Candidatus Woesearchaeota archaeon]
MKNALSRLPDAQGVGFEVLTPQMWLDNDHATGIYARPPKDTIYVAASSYWTGKVRPVEAWLDDLAHEAAHALQWQALVNHYAQQSGTDLEARRKAYNTFFSSPHKEWVEGLAEFAAIYSAFQNEQENGRSFSVLMLGRHLALMPKSIREYLSLRGLPKGIEGKLSSAERREVEEINTRVQEIEERTSHLIRGHPAWEGYKALRQPYANGFGRMMAVSTLWPDVSFRDLFLTPFSKGDSLADYEVKVQETKRMVGED